MSCSSFVFIYFLHEVVGFIPGVSMRLDKIMEIVKDYDYIIIIIAPYIDRLILLYFNFGLI